MAIGNPEEVFSPRSTVVEILRKWSVYDINIIGFCMIPEDVHSVHDNGSTKNNGNLMFKIQWIFGNQRNPVVDHRKPPLQLPPTPLELVEVRRTQP